MLKTIADTRLPNAFPSLVWTDGGYASIVETPLELCAHPRDIFQETLAETKAGKWHLLDANGRAFDIGDWQKIKWFGGLEGFSLLLMGRIIVAPHLLNERQLTLDDFNRELERIVRARFRHDIESYELADSLASLPAAVTYLEALRAVRVR